MSSAHLYIRERQSIKPDLFHAQFIRSGWQVCELAAAGEIGFAAQRNV
jgi:hypothetical protein